MLFSSIEKLVSFVCAASADGLLEELIAELELRYVETPLGTRGLVARFAAESSYRMDRVSALGRLAGGSLFTGAGRHYVQYRDKSAPLGYDVRALVDSPDGLIVYATDHEQSYAIGRALPLLELLERLTPRPAVETKDEAGAVYVLAALGVGGPLIGYLYRSAVDARVALVEWPAASAFDEGLRQMQLFELPSPPPRLLSLLRAMPGAWVFRPEGDHAAVELGFRHPVDLATCADAFPPETLTLVRGRGPVERVAPRPVFAPVAALCRLGIAPPSAPVTTTGQPSDVADTWSVPVQVVPSAAAPRRVMATFVPTDAQRYLARILYALPARALATARAALTADGAYLIDPHGIDGIPLGRFFAEAAEGVYVPLGMRIAPEVAPAVLSAHLRPEGDEEVFFHGPARPPVRLPGSAFAPLSTRLLGALSARPVHADAPEAPETPLSRFRYGPPTRRPLRDLPDPREGG